jgi:G3E family GTPase
MTDHLLPNTALVPYTVLGGYLGAGKTTLLNELLRANHGKRLAIIVNDFGDIGIDADLIVDRDGDTINLTNGCICCSLSDGLAIVLDDLRQRADEIDHVIVEASGVSDPVRIGDYGRPFGFELRGVIVLADAEQIRIRATDKYVGDTVISQLRGADMLVLTKTDLVDDNELAAVHSWLAEQAPNAPILEMALGHLSSEIILGDIEPTSVKVGHDDVHELGYDSWSYVAGEPIDRALLEAFIEALPDGMLRAKGIMQLADDLEHRWVVQVVGRRSTLVQGQRWNAERPNTRLIVLAVPGSLDGDQLDNAIQLCRSPAGQPNT